MRDKGFNGTSLIRVTDHNWRKLNSLKDTGESFNTVISKLLSSYEAKLRISEKE